MIKKIFHILLFFCFSVVAVAQSSNPYDNYPAPQRTYKSLFYVQRSHNKNTIVYDLNVNEDGRLVTETPIHPYWIRYEEGGEIQELSFIQRKYAYGLDYTPIDISKGYYKVYFVCYSKKYFELKRSTHDNRFHAYISLNGKYIEMKKVFVKTEGGTFWFPVVKYIEVTGIDMSTMQNISVRFVP